MVCISNETIRFFCHLKKEELEKLLIETRMDKELKALIVSILDRKSGDTNIPDKAERKLSCNEQT
jgi:hypothetical protein